MNKIPIGILIATFSMICLGVSNFLYKKSTQVMSPINTTFFYYLFSVCIAAVVWFFFREKDSIERTDLVWPALIAVFLFSSVLSFNYAVQYLTVSAGATIRSLSFVTTIVLAVIFYGEPLKSKDYLAICLAIGAVVLFGWNTEPKRVESHTVNPSKQTLPD